MRTLSFDESAFVFGGQQSTASQTGGRNPMSDGSGSTTDQVIQNARDGNIGSAIGTAMDNPFTIAGNGFDGMVHAVSGWWSNVTRDPGALGPPDENGVRRSADGTRIQVPFVRNEEKDD